jgi:hypothetical protein
VRGPLDQVGGVHDVVEARRHGNRTQVAQVPGVEVAAAANTRADLRQVDVDPGDVALGGVEVERGDPAAAGVEHA